MNDTDVMIDLETLDISTNAIILSVGMQAFNFNQRKLGPQFYRVVARTEQMQRGRSWSEATLAWWRKQAAAAQDVMDAPGVDVSTVLSEAYPMLKRAHRVWSNGADFDIPLLADLYKMWGQSVPYNYWSHRCFRTFRALGKLPKAKVAHNALADAQQQTIELLLVAEEKGLTFP